MRLIIILAVVCVLATTSSGEEKKKKKKDLLHYTEADLERLYDEWEENDEDELEEDEKPLHKRTQKPIDIDKMKKEAGNPSDLLKMARKGQTLMMFVGIADPSQPEKKDIREFSDTWTGIWHSNLYNNHIDVQIFIIEDNRAIFMFSDGAQAFEAKEFLLKQPQVTEVTMEGQTWSGPAATGKTEL